MNQLSRYLQIQNVAWPEDHDKKDDKKGVLYDIALVELASPFKWSASVKPACLTTSDLVDTYEGPLMVSDTNLVFGLEMMK